MKELYSTMILCGLFFGCKGEPGEGSSTTATASSAGTELVLSASAEAGRQILSGSCRACHEDPEQDGHFEGIFAFDVNKFTYHTLAEHAAENYNGSSIADLARFIDNAMPDCEGSCAEDAAAYLWSLRGQTPAVQYFACDNSAELLYGRRDLKLLTSFEYHNSLQALFNLPLPDDFSTQNRANDDTMVNNMPNHTLEALSEGRLEAYDGNAKELADWALNTDGALTFICQEKSTCASAFIKDFAYPAFRRPLTASERSEYRAIISGAADLQSGLRWAIQSVLISPQFLYRSELGMSVAQARDYTPESPSDEDVAIGEPSITFAMPDTSYDSDDMAAYDAYKYVQGTAPYSWSGDDIVVVRVQSDGGGGHFGLKVLSDEQHEFTQELDFTGTTSLSFRLKGLSGDDITLQTYNQSNSEIAVSKLVIGPATAPPVPSELFPDLSAADDQAFVLDAFEFASALSYMFSGSPPDKTLLQAAFDGELNSASTVEQHIERLLDSDLGREHIGRMAGIWFRTDEVTGVNRNGNDAFTQEVKDSMAQEIRELFKAVFYDDTLPFEAIYSGDFTLLDSVLSEFYDIPGGGNEAMQFNLVDTSNSRRGGVIASGAFMATNAHMEQSSPIKRAVHVRQDMLCQDIPLPLNLDDEGAREEFAKLLSAGLEAGNLSTAEFFHIQTAIPGTSCETCHKSIINPMFAIDDFDQVGMPRQMVDGLVVQTGEGDNGLENIAIDQINEGGWLYSGEVVGKLGAAQVDQAQAAGEGIQFSGAKDLGAKMVAANLPGIHACLIEKTARYGLSVFLDPAFENAEQEKPLSDTQKSHLTCLKEDMEAAYFANNDSPKAAFKALGMSDAIRFRR